MEVKRITSGNRHFVAKIYQDSAPLNPRQEFDHIGVMLCVPLRNYRLGDRQCSAAEMAELVRGKVHLPLYLLDHSGITMRTTDFRDPWDSGQVGYIYADVAAAERLMGRIPSEKELRDILESEVKEYDCYLRGDVWGYEVLAAPLGSTTDDEDDNSMEIVDSCWGFIGHDIVERTVNDILDTLEQHRMARPRWLPLPGLSIEPAELT